MLTDGMVALMNATAAVTDIAGHRIAPPPAGEDLSSDYPCIVYSLASYDTDYATDGPVGFSQARVILQCFAIRKADANALADAVRRLFSGYAGTLPDATMVDSVEVVNMNDTFDPGSRIYTFTVHLMVRFSEQ